MKGQGELEELLGYARLQYELLRSSFRVMGEKAEVKGVAG